MNPCAHHMRSLDQSRRSKMEMVETAHASYVIRYKRIPSCLYPVNGVIEFDAKKSTVLRILYKSLL